MNKNEVLLTTGYLQIPKLGEIGLTLEGEAVTDFSGYVERIVYGRDGGRNGRTVYVTSDSEVSTIPLPSGSYFVTVSFLSEAYSPDMGLTYRGTEVASETIGVTISNYLTTILSEDVAGGRYVTVTFDTAEGTLVEPQSVRYGRCARKPENPLRDGFGFAGWKSDDGSYFDFGSPVRKDITLHAVWKNEKEYRVGGKGPAGGIIFYDAGERKTSMYVDSSGRTCTYTWRYLEAAPCDLGTYVFGYGRKPLRSYGSDSPAGCDTVLIGSGRYNTTLLVQRMKENAFSDVMCTETTAEYAAKVCDDYEYTNEETGVTYCDWFLPSLEELLHMGMSLYRNGKGGLRNSCYWSSSAYSDLYSFIYGFAAAEVANGNREDGHRVRPVRAF